MERDFNKIKQCMKCRRYITGVSCVAYPFKIPEEILNGLHNHTKPFKGDNGIRFEPIKE